MNFGFVPKRTYDILQENCNKINDRRMYLAKENKELQIKVKNLEEMLEDARNRMKKIAKKYPEVDEKLTGIKKQTKKATTKTPKKEAK